MADINKIFYYLENPLLHKEALTDCSTLLVSPVGMRKQISQMIDREIRAAKKGQPASIILKLNSLSDITLIDKLCHASTVGVKVDLIIRGIYSAKKLLKKKEKTPRAISIVDEYLEHARVLVFHNDGDPRVYISSADWMVRNLDHRVEAACPVLDVQLKNELIEILQIQLKDNVKARILDTDFHNNYVTSHRDKTVRSQHEIYRFLSRK
jgi:polyphosphate kinase